MHRLVRFSVGGELMFFYIRIDCWLILVVMLFVFCTNAVQVVSHFIPTCYRRLEPL